MPDQPIEIGKAQASPSKEFFVKMLTRDISLEDALLDLLDNCIDGIVRSGSAKSDPKRPYEGFWAKLVMNKDHFVIEDNCGGIPFEIAKTRAFALGRPPIAGDNPSSVVGMYGIGMKRAIFKLGMEAVVESRNDRGLMVVISNEWMTEDAWNELPMYDLAPSKLTTNGTRIEIHSLNHEAAQLFNDDQWVDSFRQIVAQHYSIIISKGFEVFCAKNSNDADGDVIQAEEFSLLETNPSDGIGSTIQPLIYSGTIDKIDVRIFAGLYRELLTDDEAEDEEETRGAKDNAGWTVACNDRVVIWKDRTRLTGWGEATVPNYHGQFIAITGLVMLASTDVKALPLTTTKRGIDASSDIYLKVKEFMRESTKLLASFTNKWKKFPRQREALYKSSHYVNLDELEAKIATVEMTKSRKFDGILKFEPAYPEPQEIKTSSRVVFSALKADIAKLADHFFSDEKPKPGQVGEAAFNFTLKKVFK